MTTPVVVVDGLTKRFGVRRGVSNVSFEIMPGEVFGFLGPNGAGKSTTIRLLLGLYRPDAGRMQVFGTPSVTVSRSGVASANLPGELALSPRLTGRQHVDRFAHVRGLWSPRRTRRTFQRRAGPTGRALSKGNRQKIGLVQAFMHRPDLLVLVLVLNEPTSGLDPLLQDEFQNLIRETVADGRTVFLSSHELDEVQRLVDRLAIIKDGSIVVTDTVDGLRRAAPRTIQFQFAAAVDPAPFASLDRVRVLHCADGRIRLSVTGSVAPLLRGAAALDPGRRHGPPSRPG